MLDLLTVAWRFSASKASVKCGAKNGRFKLLSFLFVFKSLAGNAISALYCASCGWLFSQSFHNRERASLSMAFLLLILKRLLGFCGITARVIASGRFTRLAGLLK